VFSTSKRPRRPALRLLVTCAVVSFRCSSHSSYSYIASNFMSTEAYSPSESQTIDSCHIPVSSLIPGIQPICILQIPPLSLSPPLRPSNRPQPLILPPLERPTPHHSPVHDHPTLRPNLQRVSPLYAVLPLSPLLSNSPHYPPQNTPSPPSQTAPCSSPTTRHNSRSRRPAGTRTAGV
jgi:hypothetical protein